MSGWENVKCHSRLNDVLEIPAFRDYNKFIEIHHCNIALGDQERLLVA